MDRAAALEACSFVVCCGLDDASKAAVVIVRVVELAAAPDDDATRAAIVRTRGLHGVLVIVAAGLLRQLALPIAEDHAVARIGEGASRLDERDRLPRLGRQLFEPHAAGKRQRRAAGEQECERERPHQPLGFSRKRIPSSRSCFSSTGLGAPTSRSCARCVFGKAITSRIDSAPAISATRRSRPKAMPPCGGAPYCRLSSRKPNLARASSSEMPSALNPLACPSARWMRIEPPPISEPLSTMS